MPSVEDLDQLNLDSYDRHISEMRRAEFPMLKDQLYLDHAGTTLYSRSLLERFQADMMSSLFGNPHSSSPSSQRSTQEIESARYRLLSFFNTDPSEFDLVFTANTTAAIKIVMDAFREQESGFDYGYHVDSHTSIVGVRESALSHSCLASDRDMHDWLEGGVNPKSQLLPRLLAFPAQSNMDGSRISREWCGRARNSPTKTYTLLDAASFASTSPLNLSIPEEKPDFVVLSLYKIFGFPDLGALIIRKECAHLFENRRYFGGGTVDMVVSTKEQWHAPKSGPLHNRLEDGTLPIHSILALKSALTTHAELFGTLEKISQHTADLAGRLFHGLQSLKHGNGVKVCTIYQHEQASHDDRNTQGPIVAFNLQDSRGEWVSNTEVEKLAAVNNIHLRTGGVCNPGGVAQALRLSPWELRANFSVGFRCGGDNDVMNGKPAGVIRLSLGAMSTRGDVARFLEFIREYFVDPCPPSAVSPTSLTTTLQPKFHIESLTVYPIKSCKGWSVSCDRRWEVRPEGLLWDREWCIVHAGNGKALSQKQYPNMALIRPVLDFERGVLRVSAPGTSDHIEVPLSKDPTQFRQSQSSNCRTDVCGDSIQARLYHSNKILEFFSTALGVSSTLARFPASSTKSSATRHSKPHLLPGDALPEQSRPILFSNESPILTISRSSLNRLNEEIKAKGGKAAHHSVFRANIILAESPLLRPGQEQPWTEDSWESMQIITPTRKVKMDFLGGCRRCQMVCIDQVSAEKNPEPFSTLAKIRRRAGKVYFGVHTGLSASMEGVCPTVQVGDVVETCAREIDK